CLGSTPVFWAGGTAGAGSSGTTLVFGGAHGLAPGQAVSYGGEIRFVTAVADSTTVTLNAPFSAAPQAGAAIGGSCCYTPATELPSVTIFDYWTPATAVQRLLCGAAVNRMEIRVNGDFHEFVFGGEAQDLIDSSSFAAGMGQLTAFPQEPALAAFDYSIVPGHMGQAWLGTSPEQFFTITGATFSVDNGVELRAREFGSNVPKGISPGRRSVTVDFDLYQLDDNACKGLYQAARQQSPISVMFQLGEQAGQLVGVHLKSVLAEAPQYDDSDTRLQWRFKSGRAQGTVDDEIVVAFA
ncbi:MAG: phage tail tube protein, partial [Acidobacteria bacterium]|nr:phage tail tube protein [Acidobacteriota bacterium]